MSIILTGMWQFLARLTPDYAEVHHSFCDGGDNTMRLLHYPGVKSSVFKDNKNTVRAGAHTDYGKDPIPNSTREERLTR